MNDKEWVLDVLDYLEAVLPFVAKSAHNTWRDPKTRPRDKRELWTAESYTKQVQEGIARQREEETASWAHKRSWLFPLRETIAQCLADEFTRWRDIHSLVVHLYLDPTLDYAKKLKRRELRVKQKGMDHMSRKYVCLACHKPVHLYDKNNNQIRGRTKENIGDCPSCRKLQADMNEIRSKYREGLEKKKELETARKEKKRRLHGTE